MGRCMPSTIDLFVHRDDPRQHRLVESPVPEAAALDDGELLVRVEKFGFSANNVTYAVLGKSGIINYFDFFPTGDPEWGRVPVWGMGTIAASRHAEVAAGERIYGYFPLAQFTRLRTARATAMGFDVDRGALPAAYNQYTLTRSDPFYLPGREDAMIVFRPLVLTSILLDDFITEGNDWFDAESVTIASASSKTSFALAAMLARRGSARAIVGLTSARHAAFVAGLGVYSQVVTYDRVPELPQRPTVVVDVAGDTRLRQELRQHLAGNLRTTITVGISHWDHARVPDAADAPRDGEPTVFFFAPAWLEKRREDWGAAALGTRVVSAWHDIMGRVDPWVRIVHGAGAEAVTRVYAAMVADRSAPDEAHVLSLWS